MSTTIVTNFLAWFKQNRTGVLSTLSKTSSIEAPDRTTTEDFGTHRKYLFQHALRRLRDPDLAEDAVQETFLAALSSDRSFSGSSTRRTWLTGILNHKVCDQLRQTYRNRTRFECIVLNYGEERDSLTSASTGRDPRDPRTELESKELREAITGALRELPCRMAMVYQLYESEGWTGRAICEALQISQENLWKMLCRARQRLRETLSSWR
jgi:RNA polymerase sigma-70 factor, ECF subfamily